MINYNFSDLNEIVYELKDHFCSRNKVSPVTLNNLKKELNKLFKGTECKDILFTMNTDKLFFGMSVMPLIDSNEVSNIIHDDGKKYMIDKYALEFDSKLFGKQLDLTVKEITAAILHEIGHIVNTSEPIDRARDVFHKQIADSRETIHLRESEHYKEILLYGLKSVMRKCGSIFETKNEEVLADEFVHECGYSKELISLFNKLIKNAGELNYNVNNKFIVLDWTLRLYKDVLLRRIDAIKTLKKSKDFTASVLDRRDMENLIIRLSRIDDSINEAKEEKKMSYSRFLKGITYRNIRGLEDDLYEYRMRARNAEDEADALYLMRAINTRMSIIDDYIKTEPDLSPADKKRWFELYDAYASIRNGLSNKTVYKDKAIIMVNYPDIQDKR